MNLIVKAFIIYIINFDAVIDITDFDKFVSINLSILEDNSTLFEN